MTSSIMFN